MPGRMGWTMKKRCDECQRPFGLIVRRWWGYRFCKASCRTSFVARIARQRERTLDWLGQLPRAIPHQ
jgi:hypothetical protein